MNKIDRMLQELCPDGVEWKKLGELGVFENIGVDKKVVEGEEYITLLNYMDVYKHTKIDSSIPQMQVTASAKKIEQCSVEEGDIFITPTSETRDDIGHAAVIIESLPKTCYSYHIMRYRLNEENMTTSFFIRYLFEADIVQKQILKLSKGLTRFGLSKYDFAKIEIPVPPLAVQSEIVRVLDNFTELTAELTAELSARREQYEYYRNRLLSFPDENSPRRGQQIKWMKMEDVFEFRNGYTPSKAKEDYWTDGTVPWFRMEDIRQNGRILSDSIQHIKPEAVKGGKYFKANTFILATTATIGEHALLIADSLANQRFTNLKICKSLENDIDVKFMFYYMFIIDEWCKNNINVSGFASVDMSKLKKLEIPIPPLEEQERIVGILDRFEALTNDLQSGLPAEIEARQQQYEYYRNRLLTFDRKPD